MTAAVHDERRPGLAGSSHGHAVRPRQGAGGAGSGSAGSGATATVTRWYDAGPSDTITAGESERAVVGAALLGNLDGLHALDPDLDLTDPRLLAVARAVGRLEDAGVPVEPLAVLAAVRADAETGWSRSASIGVYIAELTSVEAVPMPASAGWHARIVREASARRRLVRMAAEVEDLAATADIEDIVSRLKEAVAEVVVAVRRVAR